MPQDGRNNQPAGDGVGAHHVPANAAPSHYQATLLSIIEAASNDPQRLRRLVYELARLNLKREAWRGESSMTPAEVRECMSALETAIERVEVDAARAESSSRAFPRLSESLAAGADDRPPTPPRKVASLRIAGRRIEDAPPDQAIEFPDQPVEADTTDAESASVRERWSPAPLPALSAAAVPQWLRAERPRVEIVYPERESPDVTRLRRRVWRWFVLWPFVQLAGLLGLGLVIFWLVSGKAGDHSTQASRPTTEHDGLASTDAAPPQRTASGMPLPASYGVYAVSNGVLSELKALPIKAPDPRIMLSVEFHDPSTTVLPDGKVVFVIFRRDLLNNAPQKASVRVVARVARDVTFAADKPVSKDVQDTWRIRSKAYELNVAPVSESREMVAVRPEAEDFTFPAGRYALVLNGFAYDFTVDGLVTDPAQCLESFAAVNGPVYTECPLKPPSTKPPSK